MQPSDKDTVVGQDATEFYGEYHKKTTKYSKQMTGYSTKLLHADIIAECYIGF